MNPDDDGIHSWAWWKFAAPRIRKEILMAAVGILGRQTADTRSTMDPIPPRYLEQILHSAALYETAALAEDHKVRVKLLDHAAANLAEVVEHLTAYSKEAALK